MKNDIQPKTSECKYTCASCGSKFEIISTKGEEVFIDVCSNCHPFYVGNSSNTSLRGRAEKLSNKFVAGKAHVNTKKTSNNSNRKESKSNIKHGLESL